MIILWLSHLIPYPPKGGVLQRSYNMVKELSRNHTVDVLAFNQRALIGSLYKSVPAGVEDARKNLERICRRLKIYEIPSENARWGNYKLAAKSLIHDPYNINWLKSNEFAQALNCLIKQEKYDLVHFDTISLVPFFPFVPRSLATTLDHHNIESHMLLRRASNERNFFKKLYFWQEGHRLACYERRFCPRFSLNITCSEIDTGRLLELAPRSKVCTIPNGVDLDYFKPRGLPVQPFRIIFVGTMNWYPNIEAVSFLAEKIWPLIKQKYPNLTCDIVGSNPPKEVSALADRFKDIRVHGFVDDVRPFIEAATVYVCPIRDGGGTKLKILDAMAMSKAIVAHPVACEGIDVTHNKNILLAENETGFVEHIDKLISSSRVRESLGHAARDLVEQRYGYQAIGRKLSDAFQRCVE